MSLHVTTVTHSAVGDIAGLHLLFNAVHLYLSKPLPNLNAPLPQSGGTFVDKPPRSFYNPSA